MLDWLKNVLSGVATGDVTESQAHEKHDPRIAACALFFEMAGIDGEFSEAERVQVSSILMNEYGLSKQEMMEITDAAQEELHQSISLWQFTNLINQNYSEEEKIRVVELLWKLIYTDDKLDEHEDYLVHRLASLLELSHKQLIAAKMKILHEKH